MPLQFQYFSIIIIISIYIRYSQLVLSKYFAIHLYLIHKNAIRLVIITCRAPETIYFSGAQKEKKSSVLA